MFASYALAFLFALLATGAFSFVLKNDGTLSYGLDLVVNSLEASGNITTAGVVECNSADIGIGPLNFSHNGKEFSLSSEILLKLYNSALPPPKNCSEAFERGMTGEVTLELGGVETPASCVQRDGRSYIKIWGFNPSLSPNPPTEFWTASYTSYTDALYIPAAFYLVDLVDTYSVTTADDVTVKYYNNTQTVGDSTPLGKLLQDTQTTYPGSCSVNPLFLYLDSTTYIKIFCLSPTTWVHQKVGISFEYARPTTTIPAICTPPYYNQAGDACSIYFGISGASPHGCAVRYYISSENPQACSSTTTYDVKVEVFSAF